MFTIKNILVTTDFSGYSATALDYAFPLANAAHAKVHLLHVVEGRRRHSVPIGYEDADWNALQKFIAENTDEFTVVEPALAYGSPAAEIIRYAAEHKIDLIVIATHGRTGLSHVVVGSIAERIVRVSPVPVLTVKPRAFLEELLTQADIETDLRTTSP